MPTLKQYSQLPTEQANKASQRLDQLALPRLLQLMNKEDAAVPQRVQTCLPSIEKAVNLIVGRLRAGGRLFFIGAGTSGRFGVLEAAECPPTFNTPPSMVQAFMAGGRASVFRSKEGAEDRGEDARRLVNKRVRPQDVVVGIAASGVTAFVRDGLAAARARQAACILVTCNPRHPRVSADVVIAVDTGPEVIAGSTRLKAGTATKLVLNMLTVASMVQQGKVVGNLMVDLQPRSKKLRARSINVVSTLARVQPRHARRALQAARGNAKTAILMLKRRLPYKQAKTMLKKFNGRLGDALGAKNIL